MLQTQDSIRNAQPSGEVMVAFIDNHRQVYGPSRSVGSCQSPRRPRLTLRNRLRRTASCRRCRTPSLSRGRRAGSNVSHGMKRSKPDPAVGVARRLVERSRRATRTCDCLHRLALPIAGQTERHERESQRIGGRHTPHGGSLPEIGSLVPAMPQHVDVMREVLVSTGRPGSSGPRAIGTLMGATMSSDRGRSDGRVEQAALRREGGPP